MNDPSIVIAYRDMGDEARRSAFAFVCDWYAPLGWPTVWEQGTSDETFTRASAINAGVRRAAGDIIAQVDPDSLVPLDTLRKAVTWAAEQPGLVVVHDRYLYLTREATAEVYGGRNPFTFSPADCEQSGMGGVGNAVVFSRQTWELAGGFDERFGLWGNDDGAFAVAADAIAGPTRRIVGDMVHLHHPRLPQSDPQHPDYVAGFVLAAAYRDAAAEGPDAVRRLVESR